MGLTIGLGIVIDDSDIVGAILTVFFVVYFIVAFFAYLNADIDVLESEEITFEEHYVKSLNDQSHISKDASIAGNLLFVYGSSKTDKEINYIVMVGNDDNGYLINQFDATKTYVFFDENENPKYIKTIRTRDYSEKGNMIFGKIFKFSPTLKTKTTIIKEELHLPEDAIEIDYNIDLE